MRVLLAHPGTQHAARLARELERHCLLHEFWTGLALAEHGLAATIAKSLRPLPGLHGLGNRIVSGIPAARMHRVPCNEIRALFWLSCGGDPLRIIHDRNEKFQQGIPDTSLRASDALIAFDTSAWQLAERARQVNHPLYLDRSIAHPASFTRIEEDLHRQYPDWCPAPTPRPDYLTNAEAQEHRLARRIVVGGCFARDTLLAEGIAAERIVVNPYGVDWIRFGAAPVPEGSRPLRFLFLGSHLARKGLPVLLDAWSAFSARRGDTELWLAGPCGTRERGLIPNLPGLRVLGTVPHSEVPDLMARTDVLVLPSFFEGFGLVLLEALAAGLPFIATPHTGAADLPMTDQLGRIVPVGSVAALLAALEHYRNCPPDHAAVRAACTGIREQFSWTAYGDRWATLLRTG